MNGKGSSFGEKTKFVDIFPNVLPGKVFAVLDLEKDYLLLS